MKIQHKLTLISSLWIICIFLILNVMVIFLFNHHTIENEMNALYKNARKILEEIEPVQLVHELQEERLKRYLSEHSMIRIINPQTQIINKVANEEGLTDYPPEFTTMTEIEFEKLHKHRIYIVRIPISSNGKVIGTLEMVENPDTLKEDSNTIITILFLASLVAILCSVVGSFYISKMITQPLTNFIHTMDEIETSLVFKKILLRRSSHDEIFRLSTTFNRMMERIEQNFLKQRQFITDASHEFKTMLTIIEGYASMLRRWGITDEEASREAVEAIYVESLRMKEMTQQLLDLASLEKKDGLYKENFDLILLCNQASALVKKLNKRDIKVSCGEEKITLFADPIKINQLLHILLDNALKYSEDSIEIHLAQLNEQTIIRVKDYGIGIPKEDLDHVFERFYRVDKARNRKTGGTGLGLSIAKWIVIQHQGTIHIRSKRNEGTEIIVQIPALLNPSKLTLPNN